MNVKENLVKVKVLAKGVDWGARNLNVVILNFRWKDMADESKSIVIQTIFTIFYFIVRVHFIINCKQKV